MSNNNVVNSETQFYLFLFILWLLSTILIKSLLTSINYSKPVYKLPPSPPSLPLLGHLHHLFSSPLYKSFHTLSSKHGPLLYLRFGSSKTLLVSSSNHATRVFKTLDLCFSSRPTFYFADKILYGTSGFINAPYGDYWRFMKRLCVTELLGQHQVERSRSIRREELHKFLKKMMAGAEKSEVVDVGAELVRLTNNVICRTSMSASCSDDDDEAAVVRKLVKESFALAGKLYIGEMVGPLKWLVLWLYGKQAAEMTKKFDELLERIVIEHEQRLKSKSKSGVDDHHKDLMDIVLEVYRDKNADIKISRENVKAFFIDLIIAGTDTSSQTMQWVIAELINHPTILTKVEQEISQALGSDQKRLIQESDMSNLPYLTAVIKETLRLHPPGPIITRLSRESCEIDGYQIPPNTPMAVNLYTIMQDPEAWDHPTEFRPKRFLHQNDDISMMSYQYKMNNIRFIPFGAGRRGCPGVQMAYALMVQILAATVQCFDWKSATSEDQINRDGDEDDSKVDMKPRNGFSSGMANSLKYRLAIRFNPFV